MKYPRTPHLPWSPGGTSDDRRLLDTGSLLGVKIIITEKMDGSNICLQSDNVFARSHSSSPNHPSFDALKAFHASVCFRIPNTMQVFGEWLFARHSIEYTSLPNYLAIFAVRNNGMWASWEEVVLWAEELNVPTVPVLYAGVFDATKQLQTTTEHLAIQPSCCGGVREGVVVRIADEFPDDSFGKSVAKWVRENHVQTDDHWKSQAIVRNLLKIT